MAENNSTIAIFKSHVEAGGAVKELQRSTIASGKFVVIAHGSAGQTAHTRDIIKSTFPEALQEYQPARTGAETHAVLA
jgi:hypothetical protein